MGTNKPKLIANKAAYQTLAAYVRGGRFPHALLIEGPLGCGKRTFAAEAAQAALCEAPAAERPCGQCRDCIKMEKGIHPDLLRYAGNGTARGFHVDTVRRLRQEAYVRPNEAAYKVLLLENTQEMSPAAQNALLKVIEEPPAGAVFLLTCENRTAMLETIRSRVQVISLAVPPPADCAAWLQTREGAPDADVCLRLAQAAGGNIGRALQLLTAEDDPAAGQAGDILYDACIGDELSALTVLASHEKDRPGLAALLGQMSAEVSALLLHPPVEGRLSRLSGRAGRLRLLQILDIIEDTVQAVQQNTGTTLLTTSLCARIRSAMAG